MVIKPVILVACEKGERSSPGLADRIRERLDKEKLPATIYYAGVRHHRPETDMYPARLQGTAIQLEPEELKADRVHLFISASRPASAHFGKLKRAYLEETFHLASTVPDTQGEFLDRIVAKIREIEREK